MYFALVQFLWNWDIKKNCGPYKTASNNSGDVCNKDKLMHSLSKIYAINVVEFGMLKMCRVYKIKAVAV